jgi:transposase
MVEVRPEGFVLPVGNTVQPYKAIFSLISRVPRVDDLRVISGIIYVIRNGLQWKGAPGEYGPHKTLYNRFVRWSRLGVFNRIFAELPGKEETPVGDRCHAS